MSATFRDTVTCEVAVLGAGPAGCAAALTLARAGVSVALVDRAAAAPFRRGEALPPQVHVPLHELGVRERFLQAGPLASPGLVSWWGSDQPVEYDYLFNPYGCGWHVERSAFDALLVAAAVEAGTRLYSKVRPVAWSREPNEGWRLRLRGPTGAVEVRARIVLDATGRNAWLARRLGARRQMADALFAVLSMFRLPDAELLRDQRLYLEAVPEGWWYAIPLPGGWLTIAHLTDADLLPRCPESRVVWWREQLGRAQHISSLTDSAKWENAVHLVPAAPSRLLSAGGPDWLAVGDAALTIDPLSGQGVYHALVGGLKAGQAVQAHLEGVPAAFRGYTAWLEARHAEEARLREGYYAGNLRWPDVPFWRRRRPT